MNQVIQITPALLDAALERAYVKGYVTANKKTEWPTVTAAAEYEGFSKTKFYSLMKKGHYYKTESGIIKKAGNHARF